jgi:hypothetical protein
MRQGFDERTAVTASARKTAVATPLNSCEIEKPLARSPWTMSTNEPAACRTRKRFSSAECSSSTYRARRRRSADSDSKEGEKGRTEAQPNEPNQALKIRVRSRPEEPCSPGGLPCPRLQHPAHALATRSDGEEKRGRGHSVDVDGGDAERTLLSRRASAESAQDCDAYLSCRFEFVQAGFVERDLGRQGRESDELRVACTSSGCG